MISPKKRKQILVAVRKDYPSTYRLSIDLHSNFVVAFTREPVDKYGTTKIRLDLRRYLHEKEEKQ